MLLSLNDETQITYPLIQPGMMLKHKYNDKTWIVMEVYNKYGEKQLGSIRILNLSYDDNKYKHPRHPRKFYDYEYSHIAYTDLDFEGGDFMIVECE